MLSERLVNELNRTSGSRILHGGYGGWVRFSFEHTSGGGRCSVNLKYHHGSGGEAPVTRGVIQTNRQAVYLPDADMIVNGHSHNQYVVPITRERISSRGVLYTDNQFHVRTPGYKQEYGDGGHGWAIERGMNPKPIGGAIVELTYRKSSKSYMGIQVLPVIHAPEMLPTRPLMSTRTARVYDQDAVTQ